MNFQDTYDTIDNIISKTNNELREVKQESRVDVTPFIDMKPIDQSYHESNIVRFILFLTMIISLFVWATVGLIIYIPMLFRMVAFYCSMVVASAFQDIDLPYAQSRLEYVINLYPDRFKLIILSFRDRNETSNNLTNRKPIDLTIFLQKAVVDIVWAFIFWLTVYLWIFKS